MKSVGLLLLFGILLTSCMGDSAIDYNDRIIKPQLEIVTNLDSIFDPDSTYEKIQLHRKNLVETAEKGLTNTQTLEDFQGNESFKNAAAQYFTYVKSYFGETPGIDSILYKFKSTERSESIPDCVYIQTNLGFQNILELEYHLMVE